MFTYKLYFHLKYLFIILFLIVIYPESFAQTHDKQRERYVLKTTVVNGDTVLVMEIPEVNIYPGYMYKNRWDYWRYQRLVRNVKAAYPYAKLAGIKLSELDRELMKVESEKKRKELIKETEKKIRSDFEEDVKKLTITQGRILIKLIDRETGNTTYYVLQNIKGNISAVFWQAIARIFGSNLKSEYDPQGEDELIERIIMLIEAGQI
jgi:hypothetical protein